MIEASAIPLNCGSFTGINSPTYNFKKPAIGEEKFILEVIPTQRIVTSGTSSSFSFIDTDLLAVSGSTVITDYITIVNQSTTIFYGTSIISSNSGIILGSQNSIASGISSGSATLIAKHNDAIFDAQTVLVSGSVGASSTLFQSYKTNSLGKHVSDAIDNRLLNKTASSTTIDIFSTRNDNTNTYVRNTQCWAFGLDLTCVSPWNSTGGSQRCGVLISPRHIIFAAHFQINNNATIRFVDANNNVITRTVVNSLTHPNYYNPTPFFPDITVGVLDQDVPNSIGFAKILPLNWDNYLPTLTIENDNIVGGFTIPCLYSDQQKKALVTELRSLILPPEYALPPPGSIPWPENGRFTNTLFRTPTATTSRAGFFESIITGDSGSPAFLIINDELVLVTVWTYGGSGGGTSLLYFKNDINSMMNTLGGGYQLTEANIDGFTSFN